MLTLGGLGAWPLGNFQKLDPLRLHFWVVLVIYHPLYMRISAILL